MGQNCPINTSPYHGTARWAQILGWSYQGFDTSGQLDPTWVRYNNNNRGEIDVWRQMHWTDCSLNQPWLFCGDSFPWVHMEVREDGSWNYDYGISN